MADIYKLIHPTKYFNDYISRNERPDGRKFQEHRDIKLNINALNTAESSALVKCGNSSAVCGIKLELAAPKAEEPDQGFVVTNVELPPLCSSKYRPGPPSEHVQNISNIVSQTVVNSQCVDLKDLCIVPGKLVWVVYCDIVCLDNDGSVTDACIITLMACLKTLTLPIVTYDVETEEISVDDDTRIPLKFNGFPVVTSFSVCKANERSCLLTDPTAYEEEMCGDNFANLLVGCNDDALCGIHKFGGSNLTGNALEEAVNIAKARTKRICKLVESCISSS